MSTYEVETVFYNNQGGVRTKECDLFSSKNQAIKHMKQLIKNRQGYTKKGNIQDGTVILLDDNGRVREQINFGEL